MENNNETNLVSSREVAPEVTNVTRPWGKFDLLVDNEPVSVKIISIEPNQELSLQTHALRSEWWTILDGSMEVELNGAKSTLSTGERIFVPQGAKHRAKGLEAGCRWLEIMFGHFDENDIIRLEDKYGRTEA